MNRTKFILVLTGIMLAANAFSQTMIDAQVPVKANVGAKVKIEPPVGIGGEGTEGSVTANASKNFNIKLVEKPGPLQCVLTDENTIGTVGTAIPRDAFSITCNGATVQINSSNNTWSSLTPTANGPFAITVSRGSNASSCAGETATCLIGVGEKLTTAVRFASPQFSQNAEVVLYSIKGNKVQNNTNLPAGIYLVKSNFFTTKVAHRGGVLKVNAPLFGNSTSMPSQALAKPGDYGEWSIVVSAEGYSTQRRNFSPDAGLNGEEVFELKAFTPQAKQSFTETVNGISFDMIYVPGGTFTLGCEKSSGCPANTDPVSGVKVSNYFISKGEVPNNLYRSVMGITCANNDYMCLASGSATNMTWYDAMEFACRLGQLTGKNYRMTTEAEWEYAAKQSNSSGMSNMNSTEEWAYNSWSATHSGGTDPVGSGEHTQKTRRDAQGTGDHVTGRLIRSVEGIGPALRLALSADVEYPPGYVPVCDIHAPVMGEEPANSYRDLRWVTGSNAKWTKTGDIAIGNFDFRLWEDGTALMTTAGFNGSTSTTNGQWFTSNNISFVFVPSTGSTIRRYAYIFLDETHGSLISDQGYTNGYIGRIKKETAASVTKPTISNLMSGEDLAKAQTDFNTYYKMVNMADPPKTQQDNRLIDNANQGWFQHNQGSVHHYRKDVDADEFRFTVNQLPSSRTMLANGSWFTINNTYLRVTHSTGYMAEYLYAVTSDGTFYHNSFMGYERGDFRMFTKTANNHETFVSACGDLCNGEIPKGERASFYAQQEIGQSTFKPAPCPSTGCY